MSLAQGCCFISQELHFYIKLLSRVHNLDIGDMYLIGIHPVVT